MVDFTYEDIRKESEPAKHLRENLNHKFKWETLLEALKSYQQQTNLKASFIAIIGQTLNNQLGTKKLIYSVMVHLRIFSTYCKLYKCF